MTRTASHEYHSLRANRPGALLIKISFPDMCPFQPDRASSPELQAILKIVTKRRVGWHRLGSYAAKWHAFALPAVPTLPSGPISIQELELWWGFCSSCGAAAPKLRIFVSQAQHFPSGNLPNCDWLFFELGIHNDPDFHLKRRTNLKRTVALCLPIASAQ